MAASKSLVAIQRKRSLQHSKMSKSFEFLNISGRPNAKDTAYKKAVRQKSMRAYHRNDRLQMVHNHQSKRESTDSQPESQLSTRPPSPNDPSTHPDPFASTSLPLKPHHHRLISIFINDIGEIILPKSFAPSTSSPSSQPALIKTSRWATSWTQASVSSPVLLAAICNHTATFTDSVDMVVEGAPRGEAMRLKQLTLGLLREEVAKGGVVGEDVLAAVAMLLADTVGGFFLLFLPCMVETW